MFKHLDIKISSILMLLVLIAMDSQSNSIYFSSFVYGIVLMPTVYWSLKQLATFSPINLIFSYAYLLALLATAKHLTELNIFSVKHFAINYFLVMFMYAALVIKIWKRK